eukprot:scaffold22689_cov163-Cylindrotheca_fusiformis.AAC.2
MENGSSHTTALHDSLTFLLFKQKSKQCKISKYISKKKGGKILEDLSIEKIFRMTATRRVRSIAVDATGPSSVIYKRGEFVKLITEALVNGGRNYNGPK